MDYLMTLCMVLMIMSNTQKVNIAHGDHVISYGNHKSNIISSGSFVCFGHHQARVELSNPPEQDIIQYIQLIMEYNRPLPLLHAPRA